MQLVESRAASETQLFTQEGVVEYLSQGTAEDQILLDLRLLDPGDGPSPGDNIHRRDHSSSSGLRRTMTFQCIFRSKGGLDFVFRRYGSSSTHGTVPAGCR